SAWALMRTGAGSGFVVLAHEHVHLDTGFDVVSATKNAPDPAARNAGNVGIQVCATINFHDFQSGDIVWVAYEVPLVVGGILGTSTTSSDLVAGVRVIGALSGGNPVYPSELVDRQAQVTGSPAQGFQFVAQAPVPFRTKLSRVGYAVVGASWLAGS